MGLTAKEFWIEGALPFAGVCSAIFGITAVAFDVPPSPPHKIEAAAPPSAEALPPESRVKEERMNEVLARAMRNLDAARMPRPGPVATVPESASAVGPLPFSPPPPVPLAVEKPSAAAPPALPTGLLGPAPAPPDPSLLSAVAALSQAVKTVREVRTEDDLVHAEESMKAAREQMEAACQNGASPLCDGAAQMKSLGY